MKAHSFLIVLLLTSSLIATSSLLANAKTPSLVDIEYPRLGFPAFVKPGDGFTVNVTWASSGWEVVLKNASYSLTLIIKNAFQKDNKTLITVGVPDNAREGLFDIQVKSTAKTSLEPHSVVVRSSLDYPTFLVTSDLHYPGEDSPKPVATLETMIAEFNALRPDFVLWMGDNVNFNRDESVHQGFRNALLRLTVPIILVAGNNDWVDGPGLFIKYQGADHGLVRVGNLAFFILNSDTDIFPIDTVQWFLSASKLPLESGTIKIIAHHIPPATMMVNDAAQTKAIYDAAVTSGFRYAFWGHLHINNVTNYRGLTGIGTTSTTFPNDATGSTYRLVRASQSGLDFQTLVPVGSMIKLDTKIDGSIPISKITFANPFSTPLTLTSTILLKDVGKDVQVSPDSVKIVSQTASAGVRQVVISVTLAAKASIPAVVSPGPDSEPPKIELQLSPETPKAGDEVTLSLRLTDIGWGLKEASIEYSYDNKTFTRRGLPVSGFESSHRTVIPTGAKNTSLTVNVSVEDYAGLKGSTSHTVRLQQIQPPTQPLTDTSLLLAATIVIVVVVLVGGYLAIRRRPVK